MISNFIISFYSACDFEHWKQPRLNGIYIALAIWHKPYDTIYFLPFAEVSSCKHIQGFAYEAAIQTLILCY